MVFWEDRCIGCGACSLNCPLGAIQMKNKKPVTDKNKCNLCGKCSLICPARAWERIREKRTAEEIIKEVEKDLVFYEESAGGSDFLGSP